MAGSDKKPLLPIGKGSSKSCKPLRVGVKIPVLCFWLLFWIILYKIINNEIFLVAPWTVAKTLIRLVQQKEFWETIIFSFLRIVLGFLSAAMVGTLLAVLAYMSKPLKELINPLITVIKATPVASFIILALLWIKGSNLSVLISFLMVIPMIYANVYQGLTTTDRKLLEMAEVFKINRFRRIRAIYIPSVIPYFTSAISVSLGFCWKAGIAAEVIGIPTGSIGERLYEAKIYLVIDELYAWTVVIILISITFEKLVLYFIKFLRLDTHYSDKSKPIGE